MRPPINYYGAKTRIAPKLLPLIPTLPIYCEAYGGSGSLLFARPIGSIEAYNDINGDLVNLYKALRDRKRCAELERRLTLTLYSEEEFGDALKTLKSMDSSPDDRAHATFVSLNQGFDGISGVGGQCIGNWSRYYISKDRYGLPANIRRWLNRLADLNESHARLARVQIYNRCALDFIRIWDSVGTVFYLDPTYAPATRCKLNAYINECSTSHHRQLVELLLTVKGAVVLSGYAKRNNNIYLPLENAGWERTDIPTHCTVGPGHSPRIETVWRNQRAVYLTRTPMIRSSLLCYD